MINILVNAAMKLVGTQTNEYLADSEYNENKSFAFQKKLLSTSLRPIYPWMDTFLNCESIHDLLQYRKDESTDYIGSYIILANKEGQYVSIGLIVKEEDGLVYTVEGDTNMRLGVIVNGGKICMKRYSANSIITNNYVIINPNWLAPEDVCDDVEESDTEPLSDDSPIAPDDVSETTDDSEVEEVASEIDCDGCSYESTEPNVTDCDCACDDVPEEKDEPEENLQVVYRINKPSGSSFVPIRRSPSMLSKVIVRAYHESEILYITECDRKNYCKVGLRINGIYYIGYCLKKYIKSDI